MLKHRYYLAALLLLIGCNRSSNHRSSQAIYQKEGAAIKYAKRFCIQQKEGYKIVSLFGDRNNYDTTSTFIVFEDSTIALPNKGIHIKSPCRKIAALSSIYATMFSELDALQNVVAIDNIDYVNNALIIDQFKKGKLKELARTPQIDLEQTVALRPDLIFTFGMGKGDKDKDKRLEQTGIPVAISIDHLEESPLARAEWIKFFAVFVDREKQADSIFNTVEKKYLNLKHLAEKTKERPTVFNEIKFSDAWYMPGGKSYVARLLKDASADYLWKEDTKFGSLPLSFEQVFARARNADFWINLSTLRTKKELLGFESRYAEFKAFKTGNLYNNTKHTNEKGYSNYWETGMIYPDRILSDLVQIFHPELSPQIGHEFYYYERLR